MGNVVIQNPPQYTEQIPKWDRETLADGEAMGQVIEQLANNDAYLKKELERQEHVELITLTAAGWQGSGPYTQAVEASGVQDTDEPMAKEVIPKGTTKEDEKAIRKAAGCVSYFETGNGTVTFTCIGKKPETDFQVVMKGV